MPALNLMKDNSFLEMGSFRISFASTLRITSMKVITTLVTKLTTTLITVKRSKTQEFKRVVTLRTAYYDVTILCAVDWAIRDPRIAIATQFGRVRRCLATDDECVNVAPFCPTTGRRLDIRASNGCT